MQGMGWRLAKNRNRYPFSLAEWLPGKSCWISTGCLWELCDCCLIHVQQLKTPGWALFGAQWWFPSASWQNINLLFYLFFPNPKGIDWQVRPPHPGSSIPSTNKPLHFNTSIANLVILRGKDVHSVDLGKGGKHRTSGILVSHLTAVFATRSDASGNIPRPLLTPKVNIPSETFYCPRPHCLIA